MSGRLNSAVIFVSLIAIAMAASTAEKNSHVGQAAVVTRGPASARLSKQAMLGELYRSPTLKHTQKTHGAVYVTVSSIGSSKNVGDTFVLRGEIRSEDGELANIDFKWSLPSGVRLINGSVSGTLPSLAQGQPHIVELTVQKTSDRNEQVHLLAGAQRGSSHFADSAQYNTDIQDTLDANALIIKGALEASKESRPKSPKVFH